MATIVLKTLNLTNFKGAKHKEIAFDGDTKVLGENGSGKSTVATAWLWVMSDTDYSITKNPNITPLGMSECVSEVEAVIEIDGKPCKVKKSQKYKEKTDDSGKTTSSIANSYSINDVEKSYKDFVADLTERGIDMDRFLIFSNPNAFTSDLSKQGREKMRNILFEMANGITDADIAMEMSDIDELKTLLENYKLNEVEQMQKSTMKKILEECGKDNEIINSRISGMLESKADVDIKALESEKDAIQAEIDAIQAKIDSADLGRAEIEKAIKALKDDKAGIIKMANSEIKKREADLELALIRLDTDRAILCSDYNMAARDINSADNEMRGLEESLNNWRDLYKKVQDEVLEEKDFKCPTCGQALPDKEIEEIKSNFESSKNERMNSYRAKGEEVKTRIEVVKINKVEAQEKHSALHKQIAELDDKMNAIRKQIEELPKAVTSNEETEKIDSEITRLTDELTKSKDNGVMQLQNDRREAEELLKGVIGKIAISNRNAEIDAKVNDLRNLRKKAEINRAQAEKILSEVERFKKYKNDKLSESINKHFTIAQFRLFKVLKNGAIEEACDVLIDGKEINSQANQSLQVLARLDIIKGLSDYFNEHYPVFADDFALFTSNSENRIKLDSQLIKLIATDGIKELEIKKG